MSQAMTSEVEAFYAHDVDVTESDYTDLDEVPDEAHIEFPDGVERSHLGASMSPGEKGAVPDAIFNDTLAEGVVLSFLIERAMLDPEAEVIPL